MVAEQGVDAEIAQHTHQGNEGQADDGGWVIRLNGVHQGNAKAFRLCAAGSIVGALARKIMLYFLIGQLTEAAQGDDVFRNFPLPVGDTQGTMELVTAATVHTTFSECTYMVTWLDLGNVITAS